MIDALLLAPAAGTAREVQEQHREHIACLLVNDPLTVTNVNTPAEYEELGY